MMKAVDATAKGNNIQLSISPNLDISNTTITDATLDAEAD